MPIECTENVEDLEMHERTWIHAFRCHSVNSYKRFKFSHTKRSNNHPLRIQRRQEAKRIYKRKVNLVLNTDLWKKWGFQTLVDLLNSLKASGLSTQQRRSVGALIRGQVQRSFGIRLKAKYCCILPASSTSVKKRSLLDWFGELIHERFGRTPIAFYFKKHLTLTQKPSVTLKDVVANAKKTLEHNGKHSCPCDTFPELQDRTGHVYIRATDLPSMHSQLKSILSISNSNPLALAPRNFLGYAFAAVKRSCRDMKINPNFSRKQNTDLASILKRSGPPPFKLLQYNNVKKILKPYSHFTFVEIDKNSKTWLLCCPRHYSQICVSHFQDQRYYKKIEDSTARVELDVKRNLIKSSSSCQIHFPRKWNLGHAKLLPKNKDIYKYRPLVSFFKFISRPLGRRISRCLSVAIKQLGKRWKTMELTDMKTFPSKIQLLNSNPKWKTKINEGEVTFLKMDIKNQFTSLDKTEVKESLLYAIRCLRNQCRNGHGFAIRRRQIEKSGDKLGHGQTRDYWNFSFNDVLAYVNFELENALFSVGNSLYKQTNGLPMGGFLSAGLAVLHSMYAEHTQQHLWLNYDAAWFRFRDDILAIVPRKLDAEQIQDVVRSLNVIYGPHLQVELEDASQTHINFLDYWISYTGQLNTWHYSKNCDLIFRSLPKKVTRYLLPTAEVPRETLIGMVTAIFKKISKASPTIEGKIVGLMQILIEWLPMGYKRKWFQQAIDRSAPKKSHQMFRKLIGTLAGCLASKARSI